MKRLLMNSFGYSQSQKQRMISALSDKLKAMALLTVAVSDGTTSICTQLLIAYCQYVISALQEIIKNNSVDTIDLVLKDFLENHWKLIKGTALCYTALPDHEITKLLCDVATGIEDRKANVFAIQLLMPGVCVDHLTDVTKNLTQYALGKVIKTHVLGDDAKYLIPISLLAELQIDNDLSQILNPYFELELDSDPTEANYKLSPTEIDHLASHSHDIKAIIDLKKKYEQLLKDNTNLLTKLAELAKLMGYNSSHDGGVGSHEVAANGGFVAIVNFFEYFNQLSEEAKKTIPKKVLDEIYLLQRYGSQDPGAYDSCLGTRKENLQRAMHGQEIVLSSISLSKDKNHELIQQCISDFEAAKVSLKKLLENNKYQGQDQRGITKHIIEAFRLPFSLPHNDVEHAIALLNPLSVNELKEIYALKDASEIIRNAIGTVENLVLLLIDFSPEKLAVLLPFLVRNQSVNPLVRDANDLLAILITLNAEKCGVVCKVLEEKLPEIITSLHDFQIVIRRLSVEQYTAVLPIITKTVVQINYVLRSAELSNSDEQMTIVCDVIKAKLPELIKTPREFSSLFAGVSPDRINKLYEILFTHEEMSGKFIDYFFDFTDPSSVSQRLSLRSLEAIIAHKIPEVVQCTSLSNRIQAVISELRRLPDEEVMHVSALDPESPLFFLSPIRQNAHYLQSLIDQLSHSSFVAEVVIFIIYLREKVWGKENIDSYLCRFQLDRRSDFMVAAYLLGIISKNVFYDYMMLNTATISFSGRELPQKNASAKVVSVPALTQAKSIRVVSIQTTQLTNISPENVPHYRHSELKNEVLEYLLTIIEHTIASNTFRFDYNLFLNILYSYPGELALFKISVNRAAFIASLKWPHDVWFDVFRNGKYPLLHYVSLENEIHMYFPSVEIVSAFSMSISGNLKEIIKPAFAFGLISLETSRKLHDNGYHISSVLDARFKSAVELHGRIGNPFEILMHDVMFHTIVLTSRSFAIRSYLSNHVYQFLKAFKEEYTVYYTDNLSDSAKGLIDFALNDLLGRTIDVGQLFNLQAVTNFKDEIVCILVHMLSENIRATRNEGLGKISVVDCISICYRLISVFFSFLLEKKHYTVFFIKTLKRSMLDVLDLEPATSEEVVILKSILIGAIGNPNKIKIPETLLLFFAIRQETIIARQKTAAAQQATAVIAEATVAFLHAARQAMVRTSQPPFPYLPAYPHNAVPAPHFFQQQQQQQQQPFRPPQND